MYNWILQLIGLRKKFEVQEEPKHDPYHIDRHPHRERKKKKSSPDLTKMTKVELDIYARGLGLTLGKRKTKDTMIELIQNHLKKEK